jgi:predicted glutamine amidotransferase
MFCHNGRIEKFILVRRRMQELLTDHIHTMVRGTTDSENIFALILTYLSQDGKSEVPPWEQTTPFGPERLIIAIKKALRQIEILSQAAGLGGGFNTCNFSLTDGDSMVCTRYCSKAHAGIDPPSLYFAFGDAQDLYNELTVEEQENPLLITQPNDDLTDPMTDASEDDLDSSSAGEESESDQPHLRTIPIQLALSKPGRILANVDAKKACLIVSSNPLTKTHTWHRMPRNSLLWYTRGSFPELRLIRPKTMSVVGLNGQFT